MSGLLALALVFSQIFSLPKNNEKSLHREHNKLYMKLK